MEAFREMLALYMHGMWQQLLPYLINDATDNEEVHLLLN